MVMRQRWRRVAGVWFGFGGRCGLRRLAGPRLEEAGEQDGDGGEGDGDPERGAESGDERVGGGVDTGPVEDGREDGDAEDATELAQRVVRPGRDSDLVGGDRGHGLSGGGMSR
jgi:hypothetical protein